MHYKMEKEAHTMLLSTLCYYKMTTETYTMLLSDDNRGLYYRTTATTKRQQAYYQKTTGLLPEDNRPNLFCYKLTPEAYTMPRSDLSQDSCRIERT